MNISKCKHIWFTTMTGETIGIIKDDNNQLYIGVAKTDDVDTNIENIILQGSYINLNNVKSYFD